MRRFAALRRQADFAWLRRRGRRFSTKSLTIYRCDALPGDLQPVVGITVTKSVGKAVHRNKVRRRIVAAVHDVLASHGAMRLLVIARPNALETPFGLLQAEVTSALQRA